MTSPLSPALDHVLVTRSTVDQWRREARYPAGRIGLFFGVRTGIYFCDPLDPSDFDFYPLSTFPDGVILFERGVSAYRAFLELHPEAEIIF
jgi:hypothetical protein